MITREQALEALGTLSQVADGDVKACVRVLRQYIEQQAEDAARLDFIEQRARRDPKMDGQHVWWPTSFNHALKGPTLRAAIDAAMAQERKA